MKRSMIAVMSVVAIVLALATQARAEFTAHLQESGVGNFDYMAVRWVSNAQLAPPVFRDDTSGLTMSDYGWTQDGNATVAWASFPQTTLTDFDLAFVGDPNTDVTTFDFFAFNGDQLVDSAVGSRNGTGPYNDNYGFDSYNGPVPTRAELVSGVPEPSTFILLSIGAISMLAYGWRRRAK